MAKITILNRGNIDNSVLIKSIDSAGLGDMCEFSDDAEGKFDICIGAAPDGFDIRESDVFIAPLRIGALLERIQKHYMAAQSPNRADSIEIAHFTLNTISSVLSDRHSGEETRLTEKEQNILLFLHGNAPDVTDRQALLDEVWGYAQSVETHTLETHIYRLRQKIEADPANPEILITEENGYRLA